MKPTLEKNSSPTPRFKKAFVPNRNSIGYRIYVSVLLKKNGGLCAGDQLLLVLMNLRLNWPNK